jgi:hypothetical protein
MHAGLLAIARNRLQCRSANGANSLLRTLSEYSNSFTDRVEISYLQSDQFRKPQPARIEELKNRLVAASHPERSLLLPLNFRRFFEQRLNLGDRQKSWEVFFRFGDVDGMEHVNLQYFAKDQKLVEAAQRGKIQPNARARTARFHELKKEGAKIVCRRFFPGEPRPKPLEGAEGITIARQGMGRSIPLALEVGQELSREQIVRLGVTAPCPGAKEFLFQETEPIGGGSDGCEVSATFPVFWVPRSKRRMADRDSTPSGEVATMGIS